MKGEASSTVSRSREPEPGASRRVRELAAAAMVTGLLCAAAYVQIPTQPVPVTLQVLFVVLAALLLSPAAAGSATGAYLLLGAAGVPVFAGGQGGLGVVAGPTGGYLAGFAVAAVFGSALRGGLARMRAGEAFSDLVAAFAAVALIYVIGTVRLAQVAGLSPLEAFVAGVAPFLGLDVVKAAVAVVAARSIRRARRA